MTELSKAVSKITDLIVSGGQALRLVEPKHGFTSVRGIHIAEKTGPLAILNGRKVLVLVDVENLNHSAYRLGFKVSYQMLGDRLRNLAKYCTLHAFFSCNQGDEGWNQYFIRRGWIPHPNDIEIINTYHGINRLANSDSLIIFTAGMLASRGNSDLVIIASGDGQLVCDIAKGLCSLPKERHIATLSLAGSTSRRLDATKNAHILENIELGQDCLRPIAA